MQNKLSEDLYKLKQREITLTQQIKDIKSKIRKYNQLKQEIDMNILILCLKVVTLFLTRNQSFKHKENR